MPHGPLWDQETRRSADTNPKMNSSDRVSSFQADALPNSLLEEVLSLSRAEREITTELLLSRKPAQVAMQRYCDAVVQNSRHIPLIWCWIDDCKAPFITPQISAGVASEWARLIRIERNWLTRDCVESSSHENNGGSLEAISRFAVWGQWRHLAERHGVRSVRCISVGKQSPTRSAYMVVYADVPWYFEALGPYFDEFGFLFASILKRQART